MSERFYTLKMLAVSAGISPRTIEAHVANKWLKPEPRKPGVSGHRVRESEALRWLRLHYPQRSL